MIQLIYNRLETDVIDMRFFKDEEELEDWLKREKELETIEIISKTKVGTE